MFRRRPSDKEIHEELEAHLAMRAEHDGTDEAAAAWGRRWPEPWLPFG